MKKPSKKTVIAFFVGAFVGALWSGYIFFVNPTVGIDGILLQVVGFPIYVGVLMSSVLLAPVCWLTDAARTVEGKTSFCAGLYFDGGPAENFELCMVFVSYALVTGLLFVVLVKAGEVGWRFLKKE